MAATRSGELPRMALTHDREHVFLYADSLQAAERARARSCKRRWHERDIAGRGQRLALASAGGALGGCRRRRCPPSESRARRRARAPGGSTRPRNPSTPAIAEWEVRDHAAHPPRRARLRRAPARRGDPRQPALAAPARRRQRRGRRGGAGGRACAPRRRPAARSTARATGCRTGRCCTPTRTSAASPTERRLFQAAHVRPGRRAHAPLGGHAACGVSGSMHASTRTINSHS